MKNNTPDKDFYEFALSYFKNSPTITDITVLAASLTPILAILIHGMNKRQAIQVKERTHIRDHEYRMKQLKKTKNKGLSNE